MSIAMSELHPLLGIEGRQWKDLTPFIIDEYFWVPFCVAACNQYQIDLAAAAVKKCESETERTYQKTSRSREMLQATG